MSLKDLAIEYTQDPFIQALVHLTNAMSRSANEIYGRRHESLLQMWKVAGSIAEDLRSREARVKQSLGLGVDSGVQTGTLGARHTMFTTSKALGVSVKEMLKQSSVLQRPPIDISPFLGFSWSLAARQEEGTPPVRRCWK